ncbi:hypothetical protein M3Y99_01628200 [Aphelenchoides fujianensis]|nr:hypothetical protein M3Y99_01628200 [Aphelenchoides fujianensis]
MTNPAVYSVNRFFGHLVPRQRVLLGVLLFVGLTQHYKLSEKGHVRMCVIGGNEPAVFSEFTCFLADGENFKKAERSIRSKPYEER